MTSNLLRLLTGLAATITAATAAFAFLGIVDLRSGVVPTLIGAMVGATVTVYLAYFMRTLNKNPTPLKIAVIGPPFSGKTVYLSVLFYELESSQTDHIDFRAYGKETIEEVNRNLEILSSGQWLPPTRPDRLFTFRASAALGRGLLARRFTIEIGDYAGEHIEQFDSSSEAWLHRSEYFKYVVASDAVFLVAGGDVLTGGKPTEIHHLQHSLLAALQVFIDEKGVRAGDRLRTPISLIITKSDLLDRKGIAYDAAKQSLQRLVDVASGRCRNFRVFFVSSVGDVGPDGPPPRQLQPRNVVEPIAWALPRMET